MRIYRIDTLEESSYFLSKELGELYFACTPGSSLSVIEDFKELKWVLESTSVVNGDAEVELFCESFDLCAVVSFTGELSNDCEHVWMGNFKIEKLTNCSKDLVIDVNNKVSEVVLESALNFISSSFKIRERLLDYFLER